jgi:hypothetical protein
MRFFILFGVLQCLGGLAWAQSSEDLEEENPSFVSFDQVLVAPFQGVEEARRGLALELTRSLERKLSTNNALVDVSEVPDFDEYGYTANIYMQACPDGEYAGCAMVVGQRADSEWVVGASLQTVISPDSDEGGLYGLTVHVVDVVGSQELVRFAINFRLDEKEQVLDVIVDVFGEVLRGVHDDVDERRKGISGEEAAGLSSAQEEAVMKTLAEFEKSHGPVERRTVRGSLKAPKFTREDLAQFRDREDGTPWDRIGLSEEQYLRFRNAGMPLVDWKRRALGRKGSLVFRVEGAGGSGPYHGSYVGKYARLSVNSEDAVPPVVERAELYQVTDGAMGSARLEVGIGLTSQIEVGWSTRLMAVQVTTLEDEQKVGEENPKVDPKTEGRSASEQGVYVKGLWWPDRAASPTLRVGAARWVGPSPTLIDDELTQPGLPTQTLLQVSPGIELRTLPALDVHAGLGLDFAMGQGRVTCLDGRGEQCKENQEYNDIQDPPSVQDARIIGWSVGAGFSVHIGLWGRDIEEDAPRKIGFEEDKWLEEDLD